MPARRKTVTTEEMEVQGPRPEDQHGETPAMKIWDYMNELPEQEWQRQTVYVYQTHPSVTRKEGEPAYLEKFGAPFDENVIRQLSPEGSRFTAIVKRVGDTPLNFHFAMVPRHVGASMPAQPGSGEKNSELVTLLKDMIEKTNSGAGMEQLRETFKQAQEIMKTTYTESLKNVAGKNPDGDLLQRLIQLKLLRTGNDSGGIVETIGVLKQLGLLGEKREDVFDQIEKLKTMGELLGWSTGGRGGSDGDDWRVSLAKNLPDVLSGVERVTLNIVQAIQQARVLPGQQPTAIVPANGQQPAPAVPANGQQPQAAQQIPPEVMQAAIDGLVKGKLVEFYHEQIEPEEVVMWLDLTAPQMVEYLKQFSADQVHQFFVGDPVLQQIAKEEKCKPWIENVLKEMKAETVGA